SYQTLQQRYLINYTFWTTHAAGDKNPAPIFVYAGIEWFARNTGFMFDIAPRFNALLVFIEHRKVGYLSSTQALADFSTLIVDLKKNLSATESPVVVFGGSYGGTRQMGFADRRQCPHLCKLASEYIWKTETCEEDVFAFFADELDAGSLGIKLVEELERDVLSVTLPSIGPTLISLLVRLGRKLEVVQ
ncbi:Lysosomal Pro-X carboxypeptidase, partial [Linum perenne]